MLTIFNISGPIVSAIVSLFCEPPSISFARLRILAELYFYSLRNLSVLEKFDHKKQTLRSGRCTLMSGSKDLFPAQLLLPFLCTRVLQRLISKPTRQFLTSSVLTIFKNLYNTVSLPVLSWEYSTTSLFRPSLVKHKSCRYYKQLTCKYTQAVKMVA